jgi:hypothetical protein
MSRHVGAIGVVYLTLAGVLGSVGLLIGGVGAKFLSVLLFGFRTRSAHLLLFDVICWASAVAGAIAGLKAAHLLYRRHFPARPRDGDPRPDYEEVRGPGRES